MTERPSGNQTSKDKALQNEPWNITPLNWNVAFPRSPQHLSNQLRGKQFNAQTPQLDLFDNTFTTLPATVQEKAKASNINVIGFDLTPPQQRAYEAGLFLLNASGRKSRRIVITPEDWLRAFGLRKHTRERDGYLRVETESTDKTDAFAALIALGMLPWLIDYKKMISGQMCRLSSIGPLWRVVCRRDTPDGGSEEFVPQIQPLTREALSEHIEQAGHCQAIAIEFDEVWLDQADDFYFYKPANLYEKVSLAIGTTTFRRQPKNMLLFLDWMFSKAGEIRRDEARAKSEELPESASRKEWTIREDMTSIALQCRMTANVHKRNWNRIRQAMEMHGDIAIKAQLIKGYAWDGNTFTVTVDESIFDKIDEHAAASKARAEAQAAKQAKRRGRKPAVRPVESVNPPALPMGKPLWKDPKSYSITEIDKAIKEHNAEITRIRDAIGTRYDPESSRTVPRRQPTPEEAAKMDYHSDAIRQFKDLKLGFHKPAR